MTMGNWGRVEESGESFIYVFGVLHHFQHRSYHDGQFCKQKKSVHTVGAGRPVNFVTGVTKFTG